MASVVRCVTFTLKVNGWSVCWPEVFLFWSEFWVAVASFDGADCAQIGSTVNAENASSKISLCFIGTPLLLLLVRYRSYRPGIDAWLYGYAVCTLNWM